MMIYYYSEHSNYDIQDLRVESMFTIRTNTERNGSHRFKGKINAIRRKQMYINVTSSWNQNKMYTFVEGLP